MPSRIRTCLVLTCILSPIAACADDSTVGTSQYPTTIDTARSDELKHLPELLSRLQQCRQQHLSIAYAFGEIRFTSNNLPQGCRIEIAGEGELGESSPALRYRCTADALGQIDWLQQDGEPRSSPPFRLIEKYCERI